MNLSIFFDWLLKPQAALPPTAPVPAAVIDEPVLRILDFLASDQGEAMGENLVTFIGDFYPPARAFGLTPRVVQRLAGLAAAAVRSGLADGSIVPDGHFGLVPSTNSRFNPTTGRFTTGPFSE